MGIEEKIWAILGCLIIFIILITDPKSSTNNVGNGKLTVMFSSITEGQRFLRKLTWLLITIFILLTIIINCNS
jgi:protein translocase SecG subunit